MKFTIITGLSGAGKSRAATFMEDMGFFCVDNLPVPLFAKFAELSMAGGEKYDRVALVTDVRSGTNLEPLFQALEQLKAMNCPYKILFMDASDETIIRRYKETRRSHPLAMVGESLGETIQRERKMLQPLRERADYIFDTSVLPTYKLKGELNRLFAGGDKKGGMTVQVISFGFKHGLPQDADLVFDVRFLPNPFYVPELRPKTGLDEEVRSFIFASPRTQEYLEKLEGLVDYLLPRHAEEGKMVLVIGVGCTGGHHRSVAIAHALAEHIRAQGYQAAEHHRDMGRS